MLEFRDCALGHFEPASQLGLTDCFGDNVRLIRWSGTVDPLEPPLVTIGPMMNIGLERVEVLELLGMTLAHVNDAEARIEISPRVPLLMAIRDKLALALREEL